MNTKIRTKLTANYMLDKLAGSLLKMSTKNNVTINVISSSMEISGKKEDVQKVAKAIENNKIC